MTRPAELDLSFGVIQALALCLRLRVHCVFPRVCWVIYPLSVGWFLRLDEG